MSSCEARLTHAVVSVEPIHTAPVEARIRFTFSHIRLALVPCVACLTHAVVAIDAVHAASSVHARVADALIDI